jgi:hypothetical protein
MKEQEKQKLRQLDNEGTNGTIQACLMDPNINQAHYADVLYYLIHKTLDERAYYEKMYQKFFNVITSAGLMTNELLELEEKL